MELAAPRGVIGHRVARVARVARVVLAVFAAAGLVALALCHSPDAQAGMAPGPRALDSGGTSLSLRADAASTEGTSVIAQAGRLMAPYATLTGPPEANTRFGSSIALSRDGTAVAIGAESDDEGLGAVWVFRRSRGAWVQQGPKLVPTDTRDVVNFGAKVAISSDGDTVLVGDGKRPAAAWVYVRHGNAWRQQGSPLEPRPIRGEPAVSARIALSADGATAVLTGVLEGPLARAAAWVFVRAHGHWVQQGPPLWSGSHAPEQGYSAALSAGGDTLVLGTAEAGYEGTVRVFVRSRGRWRADGRSLPGSGVVNGLGAGVAISADGRTALVGAPAAEAELGLAFVYRRTRTGWRRIARLTASDLEKGARFGASVSLSADGRTAVVRAPTAGEKTFVFARSGDDWVRTDTLSGVSGPISLAGDGNSILTAPSANGLTYTAQLLARTHSTWSGQSASFAPGELSGHDSSWFAQSVALSADGATALVGDEGGAWVFVRTATGWMQQGGKLEGVSQDHETSVALSADGDTAVIGEPTEKGGGAAWVFSRAGQAWSPGTPLVPSGASSVSSAASAFAESQGFGGSVAISGNGATVLVGDAGDAGGLGAVWVFAGGGSSWTQQGSKLTADDELGSGEFGESVALSGDGDTALIGGPQDNLQNKANGTAPPNSGSGAGWIFTRTGAAWSQTAKLVEQGEAHEAQLGFAVGLSAGGETALVGGPGEVASYALSGPAWAQQGPPLTPGPDGEDAFGTRLALSADGATAIVAGTPEAGCGKYMENSCSTNGTVWAFSRSGSTWQREPGPLTHRIPFGSSVALSGDGETALIKGSTPGAEPGGAAFVSQVGP